MSSAWRIEVRDLDGTGARRARVWDVSAHPDYWPAVTGVSCPSGCGGTVHWAEAGYVPGYRICDACGRHFLASGSAEAPTLILVRGVR